MLHQGVGKRLGCAISEQPSRFAWRVGGLLLQCLKLALEVMGGFAPLSFLSDAVLDPGLFGFQGLQVGAVLLNKRHVGFKLFSFPLANRGQETGVGFALALARVGDGQKIATDRTLELRGAADIDQTLNNQGEDREAGGSHQGGRGLGKPLNFSYNRMERSREGVQGVVLRFKMLPNDLRVRPVSLAVLGEPAGASGEGVRGPSTLQGVGGIPTGRVGALLPGERVEGQ